MTKIVSYSHNFRGLNKKDIIKDNELIKLNTEILNANDSLKCFSIKLNDNENCSYNNPVIEFLILESEYNYKSKTINNYDILLFDNVRNMFKSGVY